MYDLTSLEYNNLIVESGRTFKALFKAGEEVLEGSFSITITSGSNSSTDSITIGSTVAQTIEVEITGGSSDIQGKELELQIGLLVGEEYEYIPIGIFLPDTMSTKGGKVSFVGYDRMLRLELGYISSLPDSTNTVAVLNEMSAKSGVPIDTSNLQAISINKPVGYTYREVLSYIAQLYGSFANVNRTGTVELHWWTDYGYSVVQDAVRDFEHKQSCTIEGIVCAVGQNEDGETQTLSAGTGATISISNPFMTQAVLNSVYEKIKGFTYTAVTCPVILADPRLDPWDIVAITDADGNVYKTPCMNLVMKYDGGLSGSIESIVGAQSQTEFDYKGPLEQFEERMVAQVAIIEALTAKKASIEYLEANYATITQLDSATARIGVLEANQITVSYLNANYATIASLNAASARIDTLSANMITADNVRAIVGEFGYITADAVKATYATIENLSALDAKVVSLEASQITVGYLQANYAQLDLANVKNGSITNAMIGDGAVGTAQIADGSITDAKIVGLTANKITAGKIDAAEIEVVNLNAANITVGSINGQQIASGAIDMDKLTSGVSGTINTASSNAAQAISEAASALTTANLARTEAGTAQSTADGKNTVFYQASAPSTSGRKVNDIWYDTNDGNKMYYWDGSAWSIRQFGTNAIANASITNALIADATIQNAKIANLDAAKITSGYISADRIAAGTLAIGKLDSSTQNLINNAQIMAIGFASGKLLYKDCNFNNGVNKIGVYNNLGNGNVTISRISAPEDCPNSGGYCLQIKTTGTASPQYGGFQLTFKSRPNARFLIKYIINLPVGYFLGTASNPMGDGYKDRWLTSSAGTGTYTEYVREVICGTEGTFSTGGFVMVYGGTTPTEEEPLIWYLSYIGTYDVTECEFDVEGALAQLCYDEDMTYINGGKIYTGTVTAVQIASNAITTDKLNANAVTAAKIAASTITATQLASNAITSDKIVSSAVTAAKIAASAVTAEKILANAVTADKISANAVTAAKIAAGAITTDKLAANAVTAAKINVTDLFSQNITATGTIQGAKLIGTSIQGSTIRGSSITQEFVDFEPEGEFTRYSGTITMNGYELSCAYIKENIFSGEETGTGEWELIPQLFSMRTYDTGVETGYVSLNPSGLIFGGGRGIGYQSWNMDDIQATKELISNLPLKMKCVDYTFTFSNETYVSFNTVTVLGLARSQIKCVVGMNASGQDMFSVSMSETANTGYVALRNTRTGDVPVHMIVFYT